MSVPPIAVREPRSWESFKRTVRSVVILLLILAFLSLAGLPWIWYRLAPTRTASVLVVDKTVPYVDFREHELLLWYFNHHKLVTPDGGRWVSADDYVGFEPATCTGTDLDSEMVEGLDLVYLADTFGVYHEDYRVAPDAGVDCRIGQGAEPGAGEPSPIDAPELSPVIFGGLDSDEVTSLEQFAQGGGSIVVEFNTLGSPTFPGPESDRLGAVVGVSYEGWVGRWFRDLSSDVEIQDRLRQKYTEVTGLPWDFTGTGLVIFAELEDRMVVLTEDMFADEDVVTLVVDEPDDPIGSQIATGTPYWYWFAGVEVLPEATVVASYRLDLTDEGFAALADQGFPATFPAIVHRSTSPFAGYLAGDFSDLGLREPGFQDTALIDPFRAWLARRSGTGHSDGFLWDVVFPIWDSIFDLAGVGTD